MGWKEWSNWLKGGIIGGIIIFIIWFAILIFLGSYLLKECGTLMPEGGEQCGWNQAILIIWLVLCPIFLLISFILGSILGSISRKITNSKRTTSSKGWRIGFWVGLIFAVLVWGSWIYFESNSMYSAGLIISLGILILSTLIGFIVGKIKNRK